MHAEPELAHTPSLSSISRMASPSTFLKAILVVLGRRFSTSPLTMDGVADAGGNNFGLNAVDAENLGNRAHKVNARLRNVVKTAKERADIRGARAGGQQCLVCTEYQRHVALDALGSQHLGGFHGVPQKAGPKVKIDATKMQIKTGVVAIKNASFAPTATAARKGGVAVKQKMGYPNMRPL